MRNYSERLHLFPSTQYCIYIRAVTIGNVNSESKCVKVETPSTIGFDGDLKFMVDKFYSMISLNIPPVLNDTHGSKMHIIVKGPNPCEQHSKVPKRLRSQANVKMYDIAWQAAEVSVSTHSHNIQYYTVKFIFVKRLSKEKIRAIIIKK